MLCQPSLGLLAVTFGTMPVAARVIAIVRVIALVTFIEMPATGRRAATHQIPQNLLLAGQKWVRLPIGWPVAAEDVRHFDHGRGLQPVHEFPQWRGDRLTHLIGQMGIDGGCGGRGMTEDRLDDPQIDPGLQQVRRKGMTQRMHVSRLGHAAFEQCTTECLLQRRAGDGAAIVLDAVLKTVPCDGREKPHARTMRRPKFAQLLEGGFTEGHVTRPSRRACNRTPSWAGSLSLGHNFWPLEVFENVICIQNSSRFSL